MRHPQSELLIVAALYVFSELTKNEIIGEHAWTLATELALEHGLNVEDALYNLEYIRPEFLTY